MSFFRYGVLRGISNLLSYVGDDNVHYHLMLLLLWYYVFFSIGHGFAVGIPVKCCFSTID